MTICITDSLKLPDSDQYVYVCALHAS